tara:strand:- start:113 stop:544 length:432 start_codon:yes stop_codon:yes gene_type:complete
LFIHLLKVSKRKLLILIKVIKNFKLLEERRLFLLFGTFNFLITNIVLHISLLKMPIFFATILSQFINLILGFYLYGKKVFKLNNLNNFIFRKYLFLALLLWFFNFSFIQIFFFLGVNKNLTAVFLVPLLILFSYFSQKNFVFR